MRLAVAFDRGIDIDRKLGELGRDFAIALGLVLVTLIPLGLRPAAVVMFSIPLSLAMGILALLLLGYSLNQVSIAGFIISLGLLVDDSVVVVGNIERRLREGGSAIESAIAGSREISAAIIGATAVLLVAFVPLAVLPEAAGDFVRPLPKAVIATVASSLLVSLTVIPFVASRVLRPHRGDENRALAALMGGHPAILHASAPPCARPPLALALWRACYVPRRLCASAGRRFQPVSGRRYVFLPR
jgi:multidrug efflux pump subunit AcrB